MTTLSRSTRILVLLAVVIPGLMPNRLLAQSGDDRTTPLGLAPGAPAGSYPLSDFERINVFNGSLSLYFPLLSIGGRGESGHTAGVLIEKHWGVQPASATDPRLIPRFDWRRGLRPGFGPGILKAYHDKDTSGVTYHLTRLTFTAPDGTQNELRDILHEGQPLPTFPEPRGQDFHTADGTAMTFHSDSPIGGATPLNGVLIFRDGRHYRIDNDRVTSTRDRNGNTVSYQYADVNQDFQVTRITDSIGRVYTFTYVSAPSLIETIQFKGFDGTLREVIVEHDSLSTVLMPGEEIGTLHDLFPTLNWHDPQSQHNPAVTTRIVLPNKQAYDFRYNRYGEVAEVKLPTGGLIRYSYSGAIACCDAIYRRVSQKTVLDNNEVTLQKTVIGDEVLSGADQYVDVTRRDPADVVISKTRHYFYGHASDELSTPALYYPNWRTGREYRSETYAPSGALVRTIDHTWAQRQPTPAWSSNIPNDSRITETKSTLDTGISAKQQFDYDAYNNPTRVDEYAFNVSPPSLPVRRRTISYVTVNGNPPVPYDTNLSYHIRDLPSQEELLELNEAGTALVRRALTTYEYDNYGGDANHAALVVRPGIIALDDAYEPPNSITARGNRTGTFRWLSTTGGSVATYVQFDVAGNACKAIDGRGFQTSYQYNDNFGPPNGSVLDNSPPVELGNEFSYAFPTSITNAKGHVANTQFEYYLGRPVDYQDPNGITGSISYDDSLDRPVELIRAYGQPSKRGTRFVYDDAPPHPRVHTYSDRAAFNDPDPLHSDVDFDSLGRESSRMVFESAGTETDFIVTAETEYDAAGRVKYRLNPFRVVNGLPSETQYRTQTSYDALDRVTSVQTPDLDVSTITYGGNLETTRDQAGKVRVAARDALGRITSVIEDFTGNALSTYYFYDGFDDVVKVIQDNQERTFAYDSLGRVICASAPEARVGILSCASLPASGVIRYTYDGNGNLITRTDARGLVSTYSYDPLSRIQGKTYSDAHTPDYTWGASYTYDTAILGKGYLASAGAYSVPPIGSVELHPVEYPEYDALGRVKRSVEAFNYPFQYTYDLAGNLLTETYPSGRTVSYTYDVAGRFRTVAEGSFKYGDVVADQDYTAHGAVQQMKLGISGTAQRWEVSRFNCRLQQRLAGLGSVAGGTDLFGAIFEYGTQNDCTHQPGDPGNNGSLRRQKILVNSAAVPRFIQTFAYDAYNRLVTATENRDPSNGGGLVWTQTYAYDRWGNRAVTASINLPVSPLTPTSLTQFDAGTNHLLSPNTYDAAGNQTRDALNRTFAYDAEGRLAKVTLPDGTIYRYYYDAHGRRFRKSLNGTTTSYVYDAFGRLAAEYGPSMPTLGTRYLIADNLGSTRFTLTETGAAAAIARHDFLPFGEEIPNTVPLVRSDYNGAEYSGIDSAMRHRFGGKERDLETSHQQSQTAGLDYFGARYMSAPEGRFTSPDDPLSYSDVEEPQSWNLYAYTGNNPLNRTDPDGHAWFSRDGESPIWIDCNKNGTCAAAPPEGFSRWVPGGPGDSLLVSTSHGTYRLTGDRPEAFIFDPAPEDISWETAGQVSFILGAARLGWGLGRLGLAAVASRQAGAEVSVGLLRPVMRSLGAAGDDMLLKKAVNSELAHAVKRGVERGVFASKGEGAEALRALSASITKNGAFPAKTLVDSQGKFLVPVGNNGYAVYKLAANGTAKLKTVLIAR